MTPDTKYQILSLQEVLSLFGGNEGLIIEDSPTFMSSVLLTGSTTIDLINPLESQGIVFDIVPFPHGSELVNVGLSEL